MIPILIRLNACLMSLMEVVRLSLTKNTVFITEYFYSCIDLIKLFISISFQDLSKQNSGKMIYASYSTIELSVLSLK